MMRTRAYIGLAIAALSWRLHNEVRASEKTEDAEKTADASETDQAESPDAGPAAAEGEHPTRPRTRELKDLDADEFALETVDPGGRPDEVLGAERDIMGRIAQRCATSARCPSPPAPRPRGPLRMSSPPDSIVPPPSPARPGGRGRGGPPASERADHGARRLVASMTPRRV